MPAIGHEVIGRGPTRIIVTNDWMADTSTWDDARKYFDLDGFTWAFADLRGYGRTKDSTGPFNLAQATSDVLELADHLGWPRFNSIGHSMSTLVTMNLGQHHADRVERAVVLTPAPPGGFNATEEMLEQFRKEVFVDEATRVAGLWQRWGDRVSAGWIKFKADRWTATSNLEAVAEYPRMFGMYGLPQPTAKIKTPLLAITGEEDVEFMRRAAVQASLGPIADDFTIVSFQQCAHYPMQEMPPMTVAAIERFLAPRAP